MSTAEPLVTSAEFPEPERHGGRSLQGDASERHRVRSLQRDGGDFLQRDGGADPSSVDPQLIAQTKQQIRLLVNEIAHLSQSETPLDEFYDGFLTRVVSALASIGGAIWTLGEGGSPKLHFQINLPKSGLVDDEAQRLRHALLLRRIVSAGEPFLAPPQSGPADDDRRDKVVRVAGWRPISRSRARTRRRRA